MKFFALNPLNSRVSAKKEGQVAAILSASTLAGDKVKNPKGKDLGKVEELMIDLESGRVAYAVLSFGGGFMHSGKLFRGMG